MTAYCRDTRETPGFLVTFCDGCAAEMRAPLPVSVDTGLKPFEAFAKAHDKCRPPADADQTEPEGKSPDATSDR